MAEAKIKLWEYGHVAYQIKGNDTYSNMVANILPDPWGWSKGQNIFFLKVTLHIELKGMEHRAPWNQIFCPKHILDRLVL